MTNKHTLSDNWNQPSNNGEGQKGGAWFGDGMAIKGIQKTPGVKIVMFKQDTEQNPNMKLSRNWWGDDVDSEKRKQERRIKNEKDLQEL